jgi:glycine cleavage system regulatory protein
MHLIIAVPHETPIQKLRDELAPVCDSLNIDWHLELL